VGVTRRVAMVRADWRRAKISNSAPLPLPLALNSEASTTSVARTLTSHLRKKNTPTNRPPQ
jgi:hypothetical protein